jgi:predicted nucleic acid-binding protein
MIIVDASVWVSYLMSNDVNHAASAVWLKRTLSEQGRLTEPYLLAAEIGGAISRLTGDTVRASRIVNLLLSSSTIDWIAMDRTSGQAVAQTAIDFRLRGADAVYVALARQQQMPLVTWDQEQLSRAAGYIVVQSPGVGTA